MRSHAKRTVVRASWARGTKKVIRGTRTRREDEDLRVFKEMQKLSWKATRRYVERLLGPA